MHSWLKSRYPQLLVQSESLGADRELAEWGRENPGLVDMTASHDYWSYDSAQAFYHQYKGVLPGCNEYIHRDLSDMSRCRRLMWGLTMGGGASWNENILAPNGPILCEEITRFFGPDTERPQIERLRPTREAVKGNDGAWYVLATPDREEVLVYVSQEAGDRVLDLAVNAGGRFRWFHCGTESTPAWGAWTAFPGPLTPPSVPIGLQYRASPEAADEQP
jgi:hypothetical protein